MLTLLFFFIVLPIVSSLCPDGFELVKDGECRGKYVDETMYFDTAYDRIVSKCNEINALPIVIHNDEHQSYWTNWKEKDGKKPYEPASLGLSCNPITMQWQWADGSVVDFKPPIHSAELDQDCKAGCFWFLDTDGRWLVGCSSTLSLRANIHCTTQLVQPIPSEDGCYGFAGYDTDGVCYQIGKTVETWQEAQADCRRVGGNLASIHNQQENSFIRRLAVSNGAVNGLYLGAIMTGKGNQYGWIDGSEWDYDNFYPGFPMDGVGNCLGMDTSTTSGQWMNINCVTNLNAACIRQPIFPEPPACGTGKENEIIYSPGFPFDSSIPCEYFLTVPMGKIVELEVLFLEANSCCDRLIVSDNFLGGTVIANLSGEVMDKILTTASTNVIRVSWQPHGGVNVRGVMMRYRAVTPDE
ncbi:hypothetical protein PRIPAC_86084 [Pristionchus pacificus]|nr:hypothetical protein PRIPAC_86084 [Pristionchus pacificus]